MAKKKHKKKHSFQHKNAPVAVVNPVAASSVKSTGKPSTMPNEWVEVADDVRRALILAGIFIVLMIALGYFLDVTPAGKQLYNSIKL